MIVIIFFSGIQPSPVGIGLVILLLVGSSYFFFTFSFTLGAVNGTSMKQLLVAGIDIAERGGNEVCSCKAECECISTTIMFSIICSTFICLCPTMS